MSLEDFQVRIKVEPGWEGDADVAGALRILYAGHVVKEELVLGPELLQSAETVFELQDSVKNAENSHNQAILERTCSVSLEHMLIDMKNHTCRIGGVTYKYRWYVQNQDIKCDEKSGAEKKNHTLLTVINKPVEKPNKENNREVNKLRGAKYFCNECQYSTKHAEKLLTHLKTHDGEKPFKISQCNSAILCKTHLKTHNLRKDSSEKPFKCVKCSARFGCKSYLKTHIRIHSGEKSYKCEHCSAAFVQSSHLNRHLKRHLNEKPYKCNQCSSKFKDRWSLLRHQGTHTGKKSYTCSECGASFNQTCNLLRHQRIHTGEKRYKCSYCDAAFVQSCDLTKHLKIHSGKGPLKCSFCVYKTSLVGALKSHIKKWHAGQKYKAKKEVM